MNISKFKKIINSLIFVIGIGVLINICILYFKTESSQWAIFEEINILYFSPMLILALGPMFFHSLRIVLWSNFLKYNLKYKDCVTIVLANEIGSAAAPSLIGGGPIKIGMLISAGVKKSDATFMMLLSTIEDLIFYFVGFLLAIFYLNLQPTFNFKSLGIGIMIFIAIIIISRSTFKYQKLIIQSILHHYKKPHWSAKLKNWVNSFNDYIGKLISILKYVIAHGKQRFVLSLFFLFAQWMSKFTILAILLYNFNIKFSWFDVYIKQWFVYISALIVPIPGGSGGTEASFVYIFSDILKKDSILIIVSIWRLFTFYLALIIAIVTFNLYSSTSLLDSTEDN